MSWETLFTDEEGLASIFMVIHLLQSLPPTTVSCEWSFSQMKLLKTSRRLRLNAPTFKYNDAEVKDFNPNCAIDLWMDAMKPQ
ncbi:hypothetical protein MAR_024118, partial [Mya arenaria]